MDPAGAQKLCGTAPLEEAESAALYAYTRQISPDCILAYHTQGMEIYWQAQGGALRERRSWAR